MIVLETILNTIYSRLLTLSKCWKTPPHELLHDAYSHGKKYLPVRVVNTCHRLTGKKCPKTGVRKKYMVKNPFAPQIYDSYFRSLLACNEYIQDLSNYTTNICHRMRKWCI